MREIVAADVPIVRVPVPVAEAMAIFEARGEEEKTRLLAHRQKQQVMLYTLRGRQDFFQGYMVPSTGCLQHFALHAFPPGFLLQFPHQSRPTEIGPLTPYPEAVPGVRGGGALAGSPGRPQRRRAERRGRGGPTSPDVSLVAEALHEARIAQIAADIAAQGDRIKVVLIAGPSSSGKTTFSKRLAVQLLANGRRPFPIGLDDYFVDRDLTPRDAKRQLRLRVPGGGGRRAVQRAPAAA